MGAKFDNETVVLIIGKRLTEALKEALKKKGLEGRMDSENGIFIIDDLAVQSVKGNEVTIKVAYEYGG